MPGVATMGAPRESLTDTLGAAILKLIEQSGLRSGDTMPSVQELAERFGVSNATLREALRRLEATDSLELRHGSGVFVGQHIGRTVLANPNLMTPSPALVLELVEARLTIEPPVAALAAKARTDEHLARLERAIATAAGRGPAPMNFHRELAAACGNVVLHEVIDSLLTVHRGEQRAIRRVFTERSRDLEGHQQILDAVRAGDAEAAASASRVHLVAIRDAIDERSEDYRSSGRGGKK